MKVLGDEYMNGQIVLSLPTNITEDLKRLWIETAGESFQELIEKQQTPRYMNQIEASKYLGISENFFKSHVKVFLPQIIVGGIIRFDRLELDKFYEKNSQ